MSDHNAGFGAPTPQAASIATANAIIDALGKFFTTPSVSNKVAAIVALQAYFAEVEKRGYDVNTVT